MELECILGSERTCEALGEVYDKSKSGECGGVMCAVKMEGEVQYRSR